MTTVVRADMKTGRLVRSMVLEPKAVAISDPNLIAMIDHIAGEGAVDKYNGIPPYAETRNYVYRVAGSLKAARLAAVPATPAERSLASVNAPADNGTETPRPIQASTGSDGRIYYRTP